MLVLGVGVGLGCRGVWGYIEGVGVGLGCRGVWGYIEGVYGARL